MTNILLEFRCVFNVIIDDGDSSHSHHAANRQIPLRFCSNHDVRKTIVDREQCPAAHQTKQVPINCDFVPLIITLCCLLHRNESINTKAFPLMPYPWRLHFRSLWGGVSNKGLLEIQYEGIYLTSSIQNFSKNTKSLLLWSAEFHSYDSSRKHIACLIEACVHQAEP